MPPKRRASGMSGNSGKNKDGASKKIKALIKENQGLILHSEQEICEFSMVLQDNKDDIQTYEERIRNLRQENVDYEEILRDSEEFKANCEEKVAKLKKIQKQMDEFEQEWNNKLRAEVEKAGLLSDLEEVENDRETESDCDPISFEPDVPFCSTPDIKVEVNAYELDMELDDSLLLEEWSINNHKRGE